MNQCWIAPTWCLKSEIPGIFRVSVFWTNRPRQPHHCLSVCFITMLEDVKLPHDEIYEVDCNVILGHIVQQNCGDWAKSKLWMVKGLSDWGKLLGKAGIGGCVVALQSTANAPQVDASAKSYQAACFVIRAQMVGDLVLWAGTGRHWQLGCYMFTKL